ncbi:MAG: 16S rRNA (adenine(1518)-N(6)/adenine(1519)-N(6))-dimethyltransferase RsmA [Elusimicrobiota bacterium]
MAEKLGQHFLNNPRVAARIVENLDIQPIDKIMEIGAGRGYLTEYLIENNGSVIAVELDSDLAGLLENKFKDLQDIINKDFLALDLTDYDINKICGNIPYQITGKILDKICRSSLNWQIAVIMLPRPVALRMVAGPASSDYSAVSVLCQVNSKVEYCFDVPETDFLPPPKVKSAVVKLVRKCDPEDDTFYRMVKNIFRYKRKNIRNAIFNFLKPGLNKEEVDNILKKAKISGKSRPHELGVKDYKILKNIFVNRKIL